MGDKIKKLNPKEKIICPENLTVGDFWSWAYSDILSNRNRSIFAEFLVAVALGVTDSPRVEWDGVDLRYKGRGIEVKSAAYIQSWKQKGLSVIRFDIAKKMSWYADTNTWDEKPTRGADCYVFCFYPETDPAKVNILDVGAWEFYVLPTEQINRELGDQKSIGIKRIQAMSEPVKFGQVKEKIDRVMGI
jgi:hypothetical protein